MNKPKAMQGEVVSDAPNKTIVVKVTVSKTHPKYRKKYTTHKRYQAHDENNEYHVGDLVEIEASRPISAHKHWKAVKKIR